MPLITELTSAVLKEMTDRQVLAENRRLHKTFSNHLRSRVKDGLFFEAPEGSTITERAATVLVKPTADSKLSDKELIAVSSDGFAYGIVKLGKPKSIDIKQFAEQTPSHRISEAERKELFPDTETLYIYPILDFGKFADPLKIKLPKDKTDLIKDVEFNDPDALDGVVVDGLSAEEIISAYFLVSTEMDLRSLKRTTNDALDKAFANSLRRAVQKFEGEMQGGRTQAAEGSSPIAKSERFDGPTKEIVIPILKRNEEEKTVTGVVLEPEVVDSQNEIYSAEVIKDAAYNFNESINVRSQLGLMHVDMTRPFTLLESYIAPVDFTLGKKKVKKGSWVMKVRIDDEQVWMAVKDQTLTGFSIHGIATAVPEPNAKAS